MASPDSRQSDITVISRTVLIILMDVLATLGCFFCGLWLRFGFSIEDIQRDFMGGFVSNMAVWCVITIAVFAIFRLYSSIWVYVSTPEVFRIIGAYAVLAVIGVSGIHFYGVALPRSSCVIGFVFSFLCTLAIRFSYRILKTLQIRVSQMIHATGIPNVMVIGAGDAGRSIAEEYLSSEFIGEHLACFIDDNPNLFHKRLCGVPVAGNRKSIPEAVRKYRIDKIIFAIPTASSATRKNILKICSDTGCKVLVLPDNHQMESSEASIRKLRRVAPEDLLDREPVYVNREELSGNLKDRVILVVGAAGTVGSELCRQIAHYSPRKLILLDINEFGTYELTRELKKSYPELNLKTVIGSVQNEDAVRQIMTSCRPDLVYHAAGHKFLSVLEENLTEAVRNNILGTLNLAKAAEQLEVKEFIMVSGVDAAAPGNIADYTRNISEKILQMMNGRGKTMFASVRVGNLLGSNGSVIPLFRRQIEEGGPVTVTDPEVSRYYMTVPEAVSLILQASVYTRGGETYVLNMGEPVKIDTMARNLIRLSGYEPDVDIKIKYIGLRPGEKLHEDPVTPEEGMEETDNNRILKAVSLAEEKDTLERQLEELQNACREGESQVKRVLAKMEPDVFKEKQKEETCC